MKKWLAISAALHALLFISVLFSTEERGLSDKHGGAGEGSTPKTVFINPSITEVTLVPSEEGNGLQHTTDDTCYLKFGGVGVEYVSDGTITAVAPQGPAARAGILVGDILYLGNQHELRGEIGKAVLLSWFRGDVTYSELVFREEICYKVDN